MGPRARGFYAPRAGRDRRAPVLTSKPRRRCTPSTQAMAVTVSLFGRGSAASRGRQQEAGAVELQYRTLGHYIHHPWAFRERVADTVALEVDDHETVLGVRGVAVYVEV